MSFRKFWDHKVVHWVVVLVIFACTGTTMSFLIPKGCEWVGIERYSWVYWVMWVFPGLVIYQFLLMGFAFVFGKYDWFKAKKQRSWARIKGWFGGNKQENENNSDQG